MKSELKEKIRLTSREILFSFFDGFAEIEKIFGYQWQRRNAEGYLNQRNIDKNDYSTKLWQLEKRGYIARYLKEKQNNIVLTDHGKDKVIKYMIADFKIFIPEKWDKKWRIVVFDIPNEKKTARDILASKLKKLGFIRLQKSIFVFPYDCQKEIDYLREVYEIKPFVQYIVAESIDTEVVLMDYFIENGVIRIN